MKRALNLLRDGPVYRREAFNRGLAAHGYEVCEFDQPDPDDLLLIWNRYGKYDQMAKRFESAGAMVLVAENGYLGKDWIGGDWYAVARNHHNGAGTWPDVAGRWESLGVELAPWREGGDETVILPQRGIGAPGVRMPDGWTERTVRDIGGRVRQHPGTFECLPLERDLARARRVVTWGSGAAIKAIAAGVPAQHDFPQWIGAAAASRIGEPLFRGDRQSMFRRLASAMWRLAEIENGTAFEHLLQRP